MDMDETVGVPGVFGCWYDGVGGPPVGPPPALPLSAPLPPLPPLFPGTLPVGRGKEELGPDGDGPIPTPAVADLGPVVVVLLGPEELPMMLPPLPLPAGPSSGGNGPAEGLGCLVMVSSCPSKFWRYCIC